MSTLPINLELFGHKTPNFIAKKQISTQGVIQNSTGVSCIHPDLFSTYAYEIWVVNV